MNNEFVNKRRKELNMSVDDLVEKSGIPKGTVSKITAGINTNPTLTTIEAICKALDCSLNDAVGFETKPQVGDILTAEEKRLVDIYRSFNDEGREEAKKRLLEMAQLNQYKKCSEYDMAEKEA